jgi:uncharacterized protein YjbI with pentapeptide repeats
MNTFTICLILGLTLSVILSNALRLPKLDRNMNKKGLNYSLFARKLVTSLLTASVAVPLSTFAIEQQYKLPPIDFNDKNRCVLVSSSMGQANAARDKLYDLRQCTLTGQNAANKDLSGMIASEADFSKVNFKEAQISK